MNPQDAQKTLLNTDYPIDKICGYSTGSFSISAFNSTTITVPHGFSFIPLFFLKWSTTSDFSISYDEIGVSFNYLAVNANADANNIYLFPFNNTGSSVTIYYRLIYFMPSNVNVLAAQTQSSLDDYVLNTDYNYTKIYEEDYVAASSATITHNLGYYPQVEAWYVRSSDGRLIHIVEGNVGLFATSPYVSVTQNSVTLNNGSGVSVSGWHYKIYLDEV